MHRTRAPACVALLGMVVLAASLLLSPGVAQACSCAPPPPVDQAVAESEWVFIGRQVDRREVVGTGWGRVRLEIEVLAVYKGDVSDTLELRTGHGSADCGIDFAERGPVGFTVTPDELGVASVGSCGGAVNADVLRLEFEPLPGRVGSGPPGFLVGTSIGPARVAVLDTAGELLTYGPGEGRLAAAAVCPGARKVVEIVEPDGAWSIGGIWPPTLEIRDLRSLEIEEQFTLDLAERDRSQLNGMGWVVDLQCHDPEARTITYLLPNGEWDGLGAANLPGPATLHVWRDGDLDEVRVGRARSVAVDAAADTVYSITGRKGTTLETRRLSGTLVEEIEVPRGHVGWKLALSADGGDLAVLARAEPLERVNWYFAEVDRLLVLDLGDGTSASHELGIAGFARSVQSAAGGFVAIVNRWEDDTVHVLDVRGGDVTPLATVRTDAVRGLIAVGPSTVVSAAPESADEPRGAVRLDLATGEQAPIEGLVRSQLAVALPAGTQVDDLPPITTTTPPISTTTVAPSTTGALVEPSGSAAGPPAAGTATTPAVAAPGGDNGGDDGSPGAWTLLTAGMATVALVGAALARRRRRAAER